MNSTTALTWGFLALMVVIFYFLLIRPQRKRQQNQAKLASDLKPGDKIITWSGIYGEVASLDEETVVIRVESGTTIRIARMAVAQKQNEPAK
jgi:preprotein translocase subunit YajC